MNHLKHNQPMATRWPTRKQVFTNYLLAIFGGLLFTAVLSGAYMLSGVI